MPALGIRTAVEPPGFDETASSGLPSPTLTNPDMVLPTNDNRAHPTTNSNSNSNSNPLRYIGVSPSTPNYTHDAWPNVSAGRPVQNAAGAPSRNSMGPRNMILLGPGYGANSNNAYASSHALHEPYLQVRQQSDAASVSSVNSDDLAGLPAYLARYTKQTRSRANADGDNEELSDSDTTIAPTDDGMNASVIESGLDEQRKEQEKHERASAILSQRAEQILANAKQRLNLMEGNLRGARDLVAPLTAANLKRATSMYSPYSSQFLPDTHPDAHSQFRALQVQTSSPSMNREFQGHLRGFSEIRLPDRPYTSLAKGAGAPRNGRIPINVNVSWNQGVRASKSFDSIGIQAQQSPPSLKKESPEPALDPVRERTELRSPSAHSRNGSILSTTSSASTRPEHLRSQMSHLQDKISSLKERAKEDKLRRQSLRSSKTPSPFSNANSSQPDAFYAQSEKYGSPTLDTSAGVGWAPPRDAKVESPPMQNMAESAISGSRNAFAEQVAQTQRYSAGEHPLQASPNGSDRQSSLTDPNMHHTEHKRTASGTAVVDPATNRYSHHQYIEAEQEPTSYLDDDSEYDRYSDVASNESGVMGREYTQNERDGYEGAAAEDEASVYEDAEDDLSGPIHVVAHEDRHDAFDYEHFFLHSALGNFSNGRRNSNSSEESTTSSVETARNPMPVDDEDDDDYSNPRTPERLKEIERNLHKRSESSDSINTLATFATAAEHRQTPTLSGRTSDLDWPIQQRIQSRPGTAIGMATRHLSSSRYGLDSDRIDSGVILRRRPNSVHDLKRMSELRARSSMGMLASPPMSPTAAMNDPAAVAVTAMLNPNAMNQLGLRDKALLFGVVESLRKVCASLHEQGYGHPDSHSLRERLEEAKKALDGPKSGR